MSRFAATLLALIAAMFGQALSASTALAAAPDSVTVYVYEGHHHATAIGYTTTERGPPTYADTTTTTFDAVDLLSRGVSACSDRSTTLSRTTYDDPSGFVRVARAADTTTEPARRVDGGLCPTQCWRVAAKTGNRVFWSGSGAAKEAATTHALANGSKTLEMTRAGQLLQRIPRGSINDRITKPLWDISSAVFAGTARGDAHVFIGEGFRGGASVFGRIEGPILNFKGNPILQHYGDAF
ncbi:hypothetical protein [Nocardioides sp. 616]|uniref:hypothetical protein n=1 Tax=Nocardioides sp. 616 TaxID=2268090 RepID=UPI000CE33ACB|nr:hypothetical protein [Nocardioides sp. 616]